MTSVIDHPRSRVKTPKIIVVMLSLLVVLNGSIILTLHYLGYGSLDALEVNLHPVDVTPITLIELLIISRRKNWLRVLKQCICVTYGAFFNQRHGCDLCKWGKRGEERVECKVK